MARKPRPDSSEALPKPAARRVSKSTTPSTETLGALAPDTLIRLILYETASNAAFKKRVSAAIAGMRGPDAVAALIDRRLTALEKARGFIDWEKIRTFAADLRASLAVIVVELKPLDPTMALQRLHRFLAGADGVLDRVDDASGRIYAIYETAAEEAAILAEDLPPDEAGAFAESLVPVLDRDGFGLVEALLERLAPKLLPNALDALDAQFVERLAALPEPAAPSKASAFRPYDPAASQARQRRRVYDRLRKAVADARGDVDAFIALERADPARRPDNVAIAERLLAAERAEEALDWIRKDEASPSVRAPAQREEDEANRVGSSSRHHEIETRILDALGRSADAQALRWTRFAQVLDRQALRDHLARLPDFEDDEALERAFAHALAFENPLAALDFLVRWPRLDLAARLVVERHSVWDGRHWDWLSPAAEALAEDYPLAASILYRALIDDILTGARSAAYGHGARHLAMLDALASRLEPDDLDPNPAVYRAALRKAHSRKVGFWSLVKE